MTRPGTDAPQWATVDEGWGRKAVDFATLSEPGNCREYVAVHHRLGVDGGDRLLDVACGSGTPELYARALAATGPAYEAIQNVGQAEFHRAAVEQARGQLRDGLPLRAEIKVVGYLARKPGKPEGAERA
jgi:2-polyprenyl-3-methyl-5-hydroxy-6-metoxy-1,4-benzoquinol methylase